MHKPPRYVHDALVFRVHKHFFNVAQGTHDPLCNDTLLIVSTQSGL